jgi:hypothetical protein
MKLPAVTPLWSILLEYTEKLIGAGGSDKFP